MLRTSIFLLLVLGTLATSCQTNIPTELEKVQIDKQIPETGETTATANNESSELVTINIAKSVLVEKLPAFANSYSFELHRSIDTKPEDAPCRNGSDSNGEFVRCDKGEYAGQKVYLNIEKFSFKKDEIEDSIQLKSKHIVNGDAFSLAIGVGNQICETFAQKEIHKTANAADITLSGSDLGILTSSLSIAHVLNETSLERANPTLHGVVTDSSGQAIENATITAKAMGATEPVIVKTDANGRFVIRELRAEVNVAVKVEKEGFQSSIQSITMKTLDEVGAECNPELNQLDFQLSQ